MTKAKSKGIKSKSLISDAYNSANVHVANSACPAAEPLLECSTVGKPSTVVRSVPYFLCRGCCIVQRRVSSLASSPRTNGSSKCGAPGLRKDTLEARRYMAGFKILPSALDSERRRCSSGYLTN
jgi:hypothetical protein